MRLRDLDRRIESIIHAKRSHEMMMQLSNKTVSTGGGFGGEFILSLSVQVKKGKVKLFESGSHYSTSNQSSSSIILCSPYLPVAQLFPPHSLFLSISII